MSKNHIIQTSASGNNNVAKTTETTNKIFQGPEALKLPYDTQQTVRVLWLNFQKRYPPSRCIQLKRTSRMLFLGMTEVNKKRIGLQ
jgi:hypothetical protein